MFKIKGTISMIAETIVVNEKFRKREFVLTSSDDTYPQQLLFQTTQDKCEELDNLVLGTSAEVSFNLRGRAWTSPTGEVKYFNTLESWRIDYDTKPIENKQPEEKSEEDLPF